MLQNLDFSTSMLRVTHDESRITHEPISDATNYFRACLLFTDVRLLTTHCLPMHLSLRNLAHLSFSISIEGRMNLKSFGQKLTT